ncbi:hypothetical protein M6B22_06325 [Jatrophihabitans cynanchi]|uniref:Acyl-CoA dehydrogenase/oxidase C-terminal domain-containing protein n=1 Tax=Jatrophihabitans cynanchi TaxID=2944128 RepID=A0ABY7K3A3_9ACTN|nr:acyl-CoA dehydrogenase family protein [Jatrophihabitans sp. SB3-54]WAX58378.1 hypothetical protein M6B22_06325 [Jatrophihabitans sp. SB3-54]
MIVTDLPTLDPPADQTVLDLVGKLAERLLDRADRPDAPAAVSVLAAHGVWTLGAPEAAGGGGADASTTASALAILGASWPALALAAAHANAAAVAVAAVCGAGSELRNLHEHGRPIVVVDAALGTAIAEPLGERTQVVVPRTDATGAADLLVLFADGVAFVRAAEVTFSSPARICGLHGSFAMSARTVLTQRHRGGSPDLAAEVRVRLIRGITAVAAGIATAASGHAGRYADERVQFGGPLSAIATVQIALAEQRRVAATALTGAAGCAGPERDVAAVLASALDGAADAATSAIQILGGYGYLRDYPVEELFRDALSLRAAANAVCRNLGPGEPR